MVQQWLRRSLKSSWRIAHGEKRAHGVLLYCCRDNTKQYGARRLSGALRPEQSVPARAPPRGLTLHEKRSWFHTVSLQSQRRKVHKWLAASFGTYCSSTYGLSFGFKKKKNNTRSNPQKQPYLHNLQDHRKKPRPSSRAPKLSPSFPLSNCSSQRQLVSNVHWFHVCQTSIKKQHFISCWIQTPNTSFCTKGTTKALPSTPLSNTFQAY